MAAHLNPPPVGLPAPPNDPNVHLPPAPHSPPTQSDVLQAVRYCQAVYASLNDPLPRAHCTLNDHYNSIIYKHGVVAQAAAAANPQAMPPPWFQAEIQQLQNNIQNEFQQLRNEIQQDLQNMRAEIFPSLKRQINLFRGTGNIVPFEVVPFANGDDPTQPPHNLPHLDSTDAIEHLSGHNLVAYLTGYAINPLPGGANPHAINHTQKETLKQVVGASAF